MNNNSLEQWSLDAADRLDATLDMQDFEFKLQDISEFFGFDSYFTGPMPVHGETLDVSACLSTWDEEFVGLFLKNDFIHLSVLEKQLKYSKKSPFTWKGTLSKFMDEDDKQALDFQNYAIDFAIEDAITIPQLSVDSGLGLMNFCGKRPELHNEERVALSFLGRVIYDKSQSLQADSKHQDKQLSKLNNNELKILDAFSSGKSSFQVADELGIPHRKVEHQFDLIAKKLSFENEIIL